MTVRVCPSSQDLSGFLSGGLRGEKLQQLTEHVQGCSHCQGTINTLTAAKTIGVDGPPPRTLAMAQSPAGPAGTTGPAGTWGDGSDQQVQQSQRVQQAQQANASGQVPHTLGSYELLELIGEGGMGAVYKARHKKLKKIVAVKVLPAERNFSASALARFEREMEAVGKLDHPNIVRAMDAGEADRVHFLVMEYASGGDLSTLQERCGQLSVADACELIRQTAEGLQHAHEHGLVHRDIKPSNLLLSPTGQVKILDFGLALLQRPEAEGALTFSHQVMGTLDYMAPEQAEMSHTVDIRADLYSLGCTLYKLLCGQAPFESEKYSSMFGKLGAHQKETPEPIASRRPGLPPALIQIVDRMLAKLPQDRFTTPAELAAALTPLAQGARLDLLAGKMPAKPTAHQGLVDTANFRKAPASTVPLDATLPPTSLGPPTFSMVGRAATPPPASRRPVVFAAAGGSALLALAAGYMLTRGAPNGADAKGPPTSNTVLAVGPASRAGQEEDSAARLAAPTSAKADPAPANGQTAEKQPAPPDPQPSKTTDPLKTDPVKTEVAKADLSKADPPEKSTLEKTLERIDKRTENTDKTSTKVAKSLDELRAVFADVAKRGGIIEKPELASEHYHNARMYEQRGDFANARQGYLSFFGSKLDVIDPHQRFQSFLKIQEGKAGAREVYATLAQQHDNLVFQFARLLVLEPDVRGPKLQAFLKEHPKFAPGWYELSLDHSASRLGVQGLADKRAERDALREFERLSDEGQFLRYYLDQQAAAEVTEDARKRLAALQTLDDLVLANPVRLSSFPSNGGGAQLDFIVAEPAQEIFWRMKDSPFESTGHTSFINQLTGKPNPDSHVELPKGTGKTTLSVKYRDIRGVERGPFELLYDPEQQRLLFGKTVLEKTTGTWVTFRDFNGKTQAQFSHLISYRYAIKELRYGVDSMELTKTFSLTPFDAKNPFATPANQTLEVTVPKATQYLAVQATYFDGSQSKVHKIER